MNRKLIEKGASQIIEGLGIDNTHPNFSDTAKRIGDVFSYFYRGIKDKESVLAGLSVTFPSKYKDIIFLKNMTAESLCPHHMLPAKYIAHFAYIPRDNLVGASKPYKAFKIIAAQPVMQEDVTEEFITEFEQRVSPLGCAILVCGQLYCFEKSGINSHYANMKTFKTTGVFKDPIYEKQFYELLEN